MKKTYGFALSLAFSVLVGVAALGVGPASSARGLAGMDAAIGQTIADFKLPDVDGKQHTLSSLKGKNGTVLIFISVNCPISNAYNGRMEKLWQDYRARGVNLIGINSNVRESAAAVRQHAAEHSLTFTILKDQDNKLADQLGAGRTPEVFFLDASNKLVYHGRIDNHRNVEMVQANDLRDAIDATLAGQPVTKTEASAFGCAIQRRAS